MWFVIIVALAIIIGIVIHKNAEKEKAQKYQEEQKRKEHQEKVNRERLEREKREKQEKEEMDHFCQALSTNPIITTAVPAIAVQCAQYLVEESKNEKYLKKEYRFNSGYSNICINYHKLKDSKESYDSISYATYGFPSIENDKKQKQMGKKAAEAFEITLKSELSKYGLTYKTYCEPKKYYYCGICYTNFFVTCEIGVLQSW